MTSSETRAGRFQDADTRSLLVDGVEIVYRELGPSTGIPLVALNHLGANLDDWDPRIVDGLSTERRIILLGYRGVGRSGGRVRDSIERMAEDVIAAVRVLDLPRIDLLGLSMGGMVAQHVVQLAPELVDRLILISSGPAGGPALTGMTRVMLGGTVRASIAFADPKLRLFFTRSVAGKKAGRDYLSRLHERRADRDGRVSLGVLRAQLSAVHRWGGQPSAGPSSFDRPVLILHGDSDRMVPVGNASALARMFPTAAVTVFPDAGHGAVFQNHLDVVVAVRALLHR